MIEQTRKDYIETRKRNRRVQIPPLSYWQKYAEMTDEQEFCRAVTEVMDKMMKPFLYLVAPALVISWLVYHYNLYWLPPALAFGLVVWWLFWGRKRYE